MCEYHVCALPYDHKTFIILRTVTIIIIVYKNKSICGLLKKPLHAYIGTAKSFYDVFTGWAICRGDVMFLDST